MRKDTVLFPVAGNSMVVYIEKNLIRYPMGINDCMAGISYNQDSLKVVGGYGCTLVLEVDLDEIYKYYWYGGKYMLSDNDSSLTFENKYGKVLLRKLE